MLIVALHDDMVAAGGGVDAARAAYARATDPSGRRYAALVTEHARRLATEAP